jgi:hypothetical protein
MTWLFSGSKEDEKEGRREKEGKRGKRRGKEAKKGVTLIYSSLASTPISILVSIYYLAS